MASKLKIPAQRHWLSGSALIQAGEAGLGVATTIMGLANSVPVLITLALALTLVAFGGWYKAAIESEEKDKADADKARADALLEELRAHIMIKAPATLENVTAMRADEIRVRVKTIADRMRALEVLDQKGRPKLRDSKNGDVEDQTAAHDEYLLANQAHRQIVDEEFRREILSEAISLRNEMRRRLRLPPPTVRDSSAVALDFGMLAGVNPLSGAANHLEGLARQLP